MARELPIVRTDFPSARRGWDPEAVQAHLRDVEALVADVRREARPVTAADAAGAQVREIVGAAERTAAAIVAGAEEEARSIRATAAEDADRARDAVRAVAERARELEAALEALAGGLRGQAPRPPAVAVATPEPQPAPTPVAPAAGASPDDEEVRFVALDLALSGRTRDDVDRDLAERYGPADRNSLLDDVFSTVEG